ncbi:hypothetical protein ACFWVU_04055 [Streptomyces sp. NPDC058686]|uniref:hypothetical protein n=1 Tax=Streptomyces sp. NPDC058686 TaxID=3346599 RepID=UPI00366656A5
MWLRQVSGERRLRAAAPRTAGALAATVTALTALGAAAPTPTDVVRTTAGYGSSTGRATIPFRGTEKPQPQPPPALHLTNVPERAAVPPCEETGNTITISDFSARNRTGAAVEWPVTAGSAPVASAGTVTKRGSVYVWKGDVAAHGKVVITQRVKASCTTGEASVITVTADVPRTNCPKDARRGGADPCTSVVTARREQARPLPPQESHGPQRPPQGTELADTGEADEGEPHTLLYAGLAASLCGLGVLAVAAARSRRD